MDFAVSKIIDVRIAVFFLIYFLIGSPEKIFYRFLTAAGSVPPAELDTLPDTTADQRIIRLDKRLEHIPRSINFGRRESPRITEPVILQQIRRSVVKPGLDSLSAVPIGSRTSNMDRTITWPGFKPIDTLGVVHVGGLIQSISLDKDAYRQGEIAFVNVTTELPVAKVKVRFLQRTYKLYALSSTLYQTILAVPMDADTGRHKMTISYEEVGQQKSVKLPFLVKAGQFAKEDTVEMDVGVLTEETLEMLKYEGKYFTRAYGKDTDSALYAGDFIWPCKGSITGLFGMARRYNKEMDEWSHKALDIANGVGTEIVAANNGVVVLAKNLDGHGRSIVISHGREIHTVYLHLDKINVEEGDTVVKGQAIGKMGSTGVCTGSNLHWQVMLNRVPTDPRYWIKDGLEIGKGDYVEPEVVIK